MKFELLNSSSQATWEARRPKDGTKEDAEQTGQMELTDGAKDAQAGEVVSLWNIVAVPHQRSDSRRSCVKVSDLVALHHIPVTPRVCRKGIEEKQAKRIVVRK